jgi:hypothetical protein
MGAIFIVMLLPTIILLIVRQAVIVGAVAQGATTDGSVLAKGGPITWYLSRCTNPLVKKLQTGHGTATHPTPTMTTVAMLGWMPGSTICCQTS